MDFQQGTGHFDVEEMTLTRLVLVRRVVEARRLAAGHGPASRTAALPPPTQSETNANNSNEKDSGAQRTSFWKKLKCW